jgi:hypothetical protein
MLIHTCEHNKAEHKSLKNFKNFDPIRVIAI